MRIYAEGEYCFKVITTSGYGNVRVYADADGIGTDGIYIVHVPEPTSLSLLGLGAVGLLLRRRRKV